MPETKTAALPTLIWIVKERLTDGSHVYDIELPGGHIVHARDEEAATEMATSIAEAISEHSANEKADVMGP